MQLHYTSPHLSAKISCYLLRNCAAVVLCAIAVFIAAETRAQAPLFAKAVTLKLNDVRLANAFEQIGDQTGTSISYSSTQLNVAKKVNANLANVPMKDALHHVVGSALKELHVQENVITNEGRGALRGTLKTSDGKPAEFVNITIKGTGKGAQSDLNGDFLIRNIPAGEHKVVIQLLGYEPIERQVTIEADETVTFEPIFLNEDSKAL